MKTKAGKATIVEVKEKNKRKKRENNKSKEYSKKVGNLEWKGRSS